MHEYAVTQSMVKMVVDEANKANAAKISEIRLVIGDLSTIIDDSVQMYFDIISEGTIAQGAKLIFKRVKAEFRCKSCGEVFIKPPVGFDCPKCGGLGTPTGVGKEFYIESIEIE
ncbi:hydrogenase nickel incorporation protein HypA/HybF [Ruminiclostridium sufflavum DSM 19573]|uniref:Hydrogenase maturation factor HypA n=1 Tax=Ruminiclostridium sufflavum DSM 19573 TaxID=1121337 RepID=A0A318XL63_9FIRM|nr:hydrogenase maturation nickel metallochaperone HypA [Ruminiclostridium sufflavum]PYG87198.1 hydrogenase nickel incorporation protein HypA/HybF [Ruminiclostridium sufflavum DSM 19573]